jgi:hypothetical protein
MVVKRLAAEARPEPLASDAPTTRRTRAGTRRHSDRQGAPRAGRRSGSARSPKYAPPFRSRRRSRVRSDRYTGPRARAIVVMPVPASGSPWPRIEYAQRLDSDAQSDREACVSMARGRLGRRSEMCPWSSRAGAVARRLRRNTLRQGRRTRPRPRPFQLCPKPQLPFGFGQCLAGAHRPDSTAWSGNNRL